MEDLKSIKKFIFVNPFYFKEVVMGSGQTIKNALNWDVNPHSLKISIQKLDFLGDSLVDEKN